MLVVDFLFRGDTVIAERYCVTLERLLHVTGLKIPGFLRQGIVILPGSATPLSAREF
jgi:hypothetical protein